jgi:hypothetical protein
MRSLSIAALLIVLNSVQLWGLETEKSPAAWQVYSNSKYGYELRFPKGFEVRPTGPEGRRDGATIRVARKEHATPIPVLDITVHPKTAHAGFPRLPAELKDFTVTVNEIHLGGKPAKEAIYRWTSNGEIAFSEVYLDGIVFHVAAAPGTMDMHKTEWWEIISSFRLIDKSGAARKTGK